ncbi:MAG: beta-ketoacyl-[Victivallales bacterium]|nr:beta-ketoacyl-[acyl-carrier-protein] synthase family protein [Victivallales bacterium]
MSIRIAGMGLICSLGNSPEQVFQNMCQGKTGFRTITRFDPAPFPQKNAGQLSDDDEQLLREAWPYDDFGAALVKYAALQALGLRPGTTPSPSPRRGLVLATNFGAMDTLQWAWQERLDTDTIDKETFAPAMTFIQAVATALGCGGPTSQISMSCASGAAAIAVARDFLRDGYADEVLVVAYDTLTEFCWCGLSNLHTITTDTMRPFDVRRSGTIFSEGAAAMLLDRKEGLAQGWIVGTATGYNAFHLTAPRPEAEGSRLVMAAALQQAGMSPDDIEHVCAHATSTSANDSTEAGALRNLFGERLPQITVAAHKSQLGHLLGAAGLAEAIITVEAMQAGVIPPTINHEQPDPKCMPLDCVPEFPRDRLFHTAITNSAGIGGNNASLVIADTPRPEPPCPAPPVYVRNLAWVLPANVGAGKDLLSHPEWLTTTDNAPLDAFNAKPFLKSVKGFLDPAGAYVLAACSLALNGAPVEFSPTRGIASETWFGSPKSAFGFFSQLHTKGPRFASPMVFPHSYANTPANLASIEFGFGGPHMVFYGRQNPAAALNFAFSRLREGTATEMLAVVFEAAIPQAFPDIPLPVNGAIACLLSTTPSDNDIATIGGPVRPPIPPQGGLLPAAFALFQARLS